MKKALIITLLLVILSLVGILTAQRLRLHIDEDESVVDIESITQRIETDVWNGKPRYFQVDLEEKPVHDQNGWYLPSIDYNLQQASKWPAMRHLEYIMAYIRNIGPDGLENEGDLEVILGMLDYWLENDFQNDKNWYSNQIGVPYDFADISVMLRGHLDNQRLAKISKILDRGTLSRDISSDSIAANANSTDYMMISLEHAVVCKDGNILLECKEAINNMIAIEGNRRTGIQEDLSYFDYTTLATAGSYGGVYTKNMAYFLSLLHGTSFQIDDEKEKLFIDYILDGQRFFHRDEGVPQFSLARSAYYGNGGAYVVAALELLTPLDNLYRHNELQKYYESLNENSLIIDEEKFFPCSGTLVSNYSEGYIAARGCMDGYSMTNVQNKEGVLNYNLSYGSNTCYMYDGTEYSAIGPEFDYSMFPGTTTYYESDEELLRRWSSDYNQTWGCIDFVKSPESNCHGMEDSDKDAGVVATELHHDGIDGKNVFIIYQGSMYVLGTNFNAQGDDGKNIITTVNQCLADDCDLVADVLQNKESYVNSKFEYINLCDHTLHIAKREQRGSFVRTELNRPNEDEKAENVFLCWYDWGTEMQDISYAYSVCPIETEQKNEIFQITNNDKCQLIEFADGAILGYAYEGFTYIDKAGNEIRIEPQSVVLEKNDEPSRTENGELALNEIEKKIQHSYSSMRTEYPRVSKENDFTCVPAANYGGWTDSFYIGEVYLTYNMTQDEVFLQYTNDYLDSFEARLERGDVITHDLGFLYSLSCVALYKETGDERAKQLAIRAADFLTDRYNEHGGFIQSWGEFNPGKKEGEKVQIIIDSMMNLPLLYWASETTGNSRYADIASSHAEVCRKYLVRADGSTYHVYEMDPYTGGALYGHTSQGYKDESTWARGQAWAIYGFALAYGYTGKLAYLETSEKCANYYINHLPNNLVPYWDFTFSDDNPDIRDTSAGAVGACGLIELGNYVADKRKEDYISIASSTIDSLYRNYYIKDTDVVWLLSDGMRSREDGAICTVWGDYFFYEALARLFAPEQYVRFW